MVTEYKSCPDQLSTAEQTLLPNSDQTEAIYSSKYRSASPNHVRTWMLWSVLVVVGVGIGWVATARGPVLASYLSPRPVLESYTGTERSILADVPEFRHLMRGAVSPIYADAINGSWEFDGWYKGNYKVDNVQEGKVYVQYITLRAGFSKKLVGCNLGRAPCMVAVAAFPFYQEDHDRKGCASFWRAVDSSCTDARFSSFLRVES